MLYLKKRFETKKNTKKDRGYLRISLAISTWGTRKFGLKHELDPVDSSWFRDEIQLQVGMSWWNSVEMYVSSCFLIFVCSFVKNLEQRKHKNTVRWWILSIYASMKNQILMMDGLIDTDQLVLNTAMKGWSFKSDDNMLATEGARYGSVFFLDGQKPDTKSILDNCFFGQINIEKSVCAGSCPSLVDTCFFLSFPLCQSQVGRCCSKKIEGGLPILGSLPIQTMYCYKGNPWKIPCVCIVWSPKQNE